LTSYKVVGIMSSANVYTLPKVATESANVSETTEKAVAQP